MEIRLLLPDGNGVTVEREAQWPVGHVFRTGEVEEWPELNGWMVDGYYSIQQGKKLIHFLTLPSKSLQTGS